MKYIVFLLLLATVPASAKYRIPEVKLVPAERLLKNLKNKLKDTDSATIYLELARLEAMLYAQKLNEKSKVNAAMERIYYQDKDKPESYKETKRFMRPWYGIEHKEISFAVKQAKDKAILKAAQKHLERAVAFYRKVLKKDAQNLYATLGFGWCLLQQGKQEEARTKLREAFKLAVKHDEKGQLGRIVSLEASDYLIPLLDKEKDKAEIAEIQASVKKMDDLPRPITPLAFSLTGPVSSPEELWLPGPGVHFDLDGSGLAKNWRWIRKDAAWLIYDTGKPVHSGLQLFGNVSFWVFWRNGYEPLQALDDNQDGWLKGNELQHIAVWNDKNTNGISEPGEIHSLAEFGINALQTSYESDTGGTAYAKCGIRFRSGECRSTYDLVSRVVE